MMTPFTLGRIVRIAYARSECLSDVSNRVDLEAPERIEAGAGSQMSITAFRKRGEQAMRKPSHAKETARSDLVRVREIVSVIGLVLRERGAASLAPFVRVPTMERTRCRFGWEASLPQEVLRYDSYG